VFSDALPEPQLRVSVGQHSDRGRKAVNQDFYGWRSPPEPQLSSKGIAIALADGIGSSDVNALYYGGNLVYNLAPASRVIPFLTVGAGAVTLKVDETDPETSELSGSETKFAANVGGGVLFALNEHFGLRFEVRDYIYRVDELDLQFRHAFDIPVGFKETVNDLSVTGGFSILF